ncbi:class I SAM-dependent methyltransferase [Candidatus Poribacteria bacterium]|nr:class I SAM-dependent methyltransferase [Candidatus Poribacteria bacterium]
MFWDDQYKSQERIWGEGPSILAVAALEYLRSHRPPGESFSILDIGCGYGRDAFYLLDNCKCSVRGIDISKKAIEIASKTVVDNRKQGVEFELRDFRELTQNVYDIVFVSNLYQLLNKEGRNDLRQAAREALKPGGLFFLSTLSVSDPEHRGKGVAIPGEPNSFQDRVYLHLCTKEELAEDFAFLDIEELREREYDEPRATGETHHHISWILIGKSSRGAPSKREDGG